MEDLLDVFFARLDVNPGQSAARAKIPGNLPADSQIETAPISSAQFFLLFARLLRLVTMPLEPCPVCGYALSTETSQCRHCPPGTAFRSSHFTWMNALGIAAALACVIYVLFFR
jgi:hypothetical protein